MWKLKLNIILSRKSKSQTINPHFPYLKMKIDTRNSAPPTSPTSGHSSSLLLLLLRLGGSEAVACCISHQLRSFYTTRAWVGAHSVEWMTKATQCNPMTAAAGDGLVGGFGALWNGKVGWQKVRHKTDRDTWLAGQPASPLHPTDWLSHFLTAFSLCFSLANWLDG